MAATTIRIERDETRTTTALFDGTCNACNKPIKRNSPLVWSVRILADGRMQDLGFIHAECPVAARKPAPVAQLASAQAATDLKRAKFASRCPGCGATIPAGAPLFLDPDLGKYVSDCCV